MEGVELKSETKVIAEIGVNHDGSLEKAKSLVELAARCGADFVKFQYFRASELVSSEAPLVDYQKKGTSASSQLEMLTALELSIVDLEELFSFAKSLGVQPFATAFSIDLLKQLMQLGQNLIKIPSGEITNFGLLEIAGGSGLPVILSTGMSYLTEVSAAVDVLLSAGMSRDDLTILHCTSSYPASVSSLNMKAITTLSNAFGVRVGYSDHSLGDTASTLALALGATLFERHLTLNKLDSGPDHSASLDGAEFSSWVATLHSARVALGDGIKRPMEEEMGARRYARRSLVAVRDIYPGEVFSSENVTLARSDSGMSADILPAVMGLASPQKYLTGQSIKW
jgi:N,N'-diacetyllegionaminate synthase